MSITAAHLMVKIDGDSSGAERAMGQTEKKFGDLGKVVAGAGIAVGVAVAGATAKGISAFVDFEGSMNEVFTLLPGLSQEAMGAMSQDVKDFSVEFGTLPTQVVPALYQAISAGVPKDNVFDFLAVAQKAAVGGVTELKVAVDGISSVVNAYGADVIDATSVSDLMFTAVKGGKTTFEEMSRSLFQVIPSASALGVEFGDVTAALATMTAKGTPTTVATTQLRQAFVELSKDGGDTADLFKELSGKTFKDFIASGGNTQEALQLLEGHAKDTGVGINDLFGSVEAGQAALALTGTGTAKYTAELAAAADSAGATEGAYAKMEEGLGRSFDKLKAAVAVAFIELGAAVAPLVRSISSALEGVDWTAVSQAISTFVNDAVTFIMGFKDEFIAAFNIAKGAVTFLWDSLVGLIGWAKANEAWLTPLIVGVLSMVAAYKAWVAIKGLWTLATQGVAAAQVVLNAVMAANPIGIIVLAVIGLVAALVYLWNTNEGFREAVGAAWEWLKTAATVVWEGIKAAVLSVVEWFGSLPETFATFMQGVWQSIKDALDSVIAFIMEWGPLFLAAITGPVGLLVYALVKYWDEIKAAATIAWNAIKGAVLAVWNALVTGVTTYINNVKTNVATAWNFIKTAATVAWNAIKGAVLVVWGALVSEVTTRLNNIKTNVTNAWNAIKNAASTAWNGIKTTILGLWDGLVAAVRNKISAFTNIGRDIANGIKNGISNVWSGLVSKLRNLVNLLPAAVKKLLGISSPSKVFAGLAAEIPAGIVQGVEGGARAVQSAVKDLVPTDLAAQAMSGLQGAFAASSGMIPLATGGTPAYAGLNAPGAGSGDTYSFAGATFVVKVPDGKADTFVNSLRRTVLSGERKGRLR